MVDKPNASPRLPWIERYPKGVPSTLEAGTPLSMPALLTRATAKFSNRKALSLGDKSWTYADMNTLVARTARGLQGAGIRRGDRVAVMMPKAGRSFSPSRHRKPSP